MPGPQSYFVARSDSVTLKRAPAYTMAVRVGVVKEKPTHTHTHTHTHTRARVQARLKENLLSAYKSTQKRVPGVHLSKHTHHKTVQAKMKRVLELFAVHERKEIQREREREERDRERDGDGERQQREKGHISGPVMKEPLTHTQTYKRIVKEREQERNRKRREMERRESKRETDREKDGLLLSTSIRKPVFAYHTSTHTQTNQLKLKNILQRDKRKAQTVQWEQTAKRLKDMNERESVMAREMQLQRERDERKASERERKREMEPDKRVYGVYVCVCVYVCVRI